MINPGTGQVFLLSDYFHRLGNSLGTYIQNNKLTLPDENRNELNDDQIELLRISGQINLLGVELVFEDVQDTLDQLDAITAGVNKAVKKALAVQNAIDLATDLVGIGTAIISKDPQSIVKKAVDATNALRGLKIKT